MRSSARTFLAFALSAGILGFAGCAAPASDRPDPTEIVQEYLDAIARGDAVTAAELDDAAIADDDGLVDADTLRTDAVLAGAERIENIRVDPETTGVVHNDDDTEDRAVTFTYELAGEQHDGMLPVGWDDERAEWVLLDTLAEKLLIQAQVSRTQAALIGFSVPGASVPAPADQGAAPISWLVYPGVYTVTGDIDPALLVDPSLGVVREVEIADASAQPALIYEVTALP